MLITTCTHCLARFRVTPQQLNLRQGQVRCGHCQKVFSGFQALERFPDDDTGTRILAARAAAAQGIAPESSAWQFPASDASTPHLDSVQTGSGATAGAGSAPESVPSLTDAQAPEGTGSTSAPMPPMSGTTARAEPSAARARTLAALVEAYAAPIPADRHGRLWVAGCVLLGMVLALQAAYLFRAKIAQGYPATRPALEAACDWVGCTVPWVNDHALLRLEDSELLEVPGKPQEIALGARIRNLSPNAQEYPHLELSLTDLTGQTAARRVLRPGEYLGRPPKAGEVMAPGSELAIQLRLETSRLKATGYELQLFYP